MKERLVILSHLAKSDSLKEVCIIPISALSVVGFQRDDLKSFPHVVNQLGATQLVIGGQFKHEGTSHRLQLHYVSKNNHRYPPKGKIVLKYIPGEPEVYLIQHIGVDQAHLIYDNELEVLQRVPHCSPFHVLGRHDLVIVGKLEH